MSAPKPLFFTPQATTAEINADLPVAAGATVYNTDTGTYQFTNDGSTFQTAASSSDLGNYLPLTGGTMVGSIVFNVYGDSLHGGAPPFDIRCDNVANIYIATGAPYVYQQTQFSATGINIFNQLISNALDPVSSQDVATKNYVDTTALLLSGGMMAGSIDMGAYDISSVATLGTANIQMVGGNINCDTQQINNVGDPILSTDAATKNYVDTAAANIVIVSGISITMTDTNTINRYVLQNSAPCTLTLPTTIAAGHTFEIIGGGSDVWSIAQNSGQSIQLGNSTTTVGVSGSLQSTLFSDSLILCCTTTDTNLTGYGVQGNITIV